MNYIIDLDGTLTERGKLVEGAFDFLRYLKHKQHPFSIMTNSIKSPDMISSQLSQLGLEIASTIILNPISAINSYLHIKGYKSGFTVGTDLEIQQVNIEQDYLYPEVIILLDFEKNNVDFQTLQHVFSLFEAGIEVITASKSKFYIKDGLKCLDTGSFVALLEAATEKIIKNFGKPSKKYFKVGIEKFKNNQDITVIGDDIHTDIRGAKELGLNTILLKKGKYKLGDERIITPDIVVKDFKELLSSGHLCNT